MRSCSFRREYVGLGRRERLFDEWLDAASISSAELRGPGRRCPPSRVGAVQPPQSLHGSDAGQLLVDVHGCAAAARRTRVGPPCPRQALLRTVGNTHHQRWLCRALSGRGGATPPSGSVSCSVGFSRSRRRARGATQCGCLERSTSRPEQMGRHLNYSCCSHRSLRHQPARFFVIHIYPPRQLVRRLGLGADTCCRGVYGRL